MVRLVRLGTLKPGVSASKPFPTYRHDLALAATHRQQAAKKHTLYF